MAALVVGAAAGAASLASSTALAQQTGVRRPAGTPAKGNLRDQFVATANRLIALINADDQDAIQALCSTSMREVMPRPRMSDFTRGIVRRRGKLVRVVGEPKQTARTARFRLLAEHGEWEMQLSLTPAGELNSLYIRNIAPSIPVPARNATPMRLPFRDEWYVIFGGEREDQNYHRTSGGREQSWAVDFSIRDAADKAFKGSGDRLEDHYAYNKQVLAAAAGKVVTVIDGVPDNRRGTVSTFSSSGNTVILKHADQEFSAYFHLKPYSIPVKVGDNVAAGQVIGRCGNSGNSSQPHLHFHLMNAEAPQDATGFRAYFRDVQVIRDGKARNEREYSPLQGDRVRPIGPLSTARPAAH